MKEEIKGVIEVVGSHPKSSTLLTAAFTSNVWLDYGLPTVQGLTSIVGLVVLILLAAKHATDLYKTWKGSIVGLGVLILSAAKHATDLYKTWKGKS